MYPFEQSALTSVANQRPARLSQTILASPSTTWPSGSPKKSGKETSVSSVPLRSLIRIDTLVDSTISVGPTAIQGSGGSTQGVDPQPVTSAPPAKAELDCSVGVPVRAAAEGAHSNQASTVVVPAGGVKVHGPVPEQAPLHPSKIRPLPRVVAVRVTVEPGTKRAEQSVPPWPQLMPGGDDVTVPEPSPRTDTLMVAPPVKVALAAMLPPPRAVLSMN